MGETTFVIVNETTRQEYKVTMDTAIVTGSIDRQQGAVISINGTAFEKTSSGEQGVYIANFNGRMADGEMKYSFSEVDKSQSELLWDAIDVIEEAIFNDEPGE